MSVAGLSNSGAMPVLEAMIRFSGQRQGIIQNNIANISTPRYQQRDVDVTAFQNNLQQAVERRRSRGDGRGGELNLRSSQQLETDGRSGFKLVPHKSGRGILFHDRNDRDLERMMQDLAENVATFRVASELYRSRSSMIRSAITERP